MNKQRITFLLGTGFIMTVFILNNCLDEAFACKRGCTGSKPTKVTPHIIHPAPRPPGFPHTWLTRDVIKILHQNGLDVGNSKPVSNISQMPRSVIVKEAMAFTLLSAGNSIKGCILNFEDADTLEKIKAYYLEHNRTGELHTWTFVKDNILLVLAGTLPEKKAMEYKKALHALEE